MTKTITKTLNGVTFTRPTGRNPLFHQYSGQFNPQPAYLELDGENQTVRFDWSGEIGNAVPITVWNRRERRIYIPASASCKLLDEYIEDHAETILHLLKTYKSDFDQNCNLVGSWDEETIQELEYESDELYERTW